MGTFGTSNDPLFHRCLRLRNRLKKVSLSYFTVEDIPHLVRLLSIGQVDCRIEIYDKKALKHLEEIAKKFKKEEGRKSVSEMLGAAFKKNGMRVRRINY